MLTSVCEEIPEEYDLGKNNDYLIVSDSIGKIRSTMCSDIIVGKIEHSDGL